MKEDHMNKQLDRLGTVASVRQASGLVKWLDGQEQGHRNPSERRKRHRRDATSWLGMEPQAEGVRAALLGQDTRPPGGFDQHGLASSPDGSDFPHPGCRFIGSSDRCLSLSHALVFQTHPVRGWDTLDGAEVCDVID